MKTLLPKTIQILRIIIKYKRIKSYRFFLLVFNHNRIIMHNHVYNFKLDVDWELINLISKIDRFDANWSAIERKEGQSLKELKSIATVRSVGASNRIEGNRMSDEEVDLLLQKIDIAMLSDGD